MKKLIPISLFLLVIAVFFGCRGSQQAKLVGTWEQISYYKPVEGNITEWVFYVDNQFDVINADGVTVDTTKYRYDIDGSVFSIFDYNDDYTNYSPGTAPLEGEYHIDVLDKTNVKATKIKHPEEANLEDPESSIFLRLELVKRD